MIAVLGRSSLLAWLPALKAAAAQQQAVLTALPRLPASSATLLTATQGYIRSVSQATSWLPPSITRLWKKQQRGKSIYPRTALQPGVVSPVRTVPTHISRPPYATPRSAAAASALAGSGPGLSKQPEIHADERSRVAMRAVGQLAAQALHLAGSMALPGTTTDDIDAAVHDFLISAGAYPSPLGYHGFPASVCTSINECVCHGIPDDRRLREGDIINIDVTAYLNGFHGDTNATYCVGQPSAVALELVETTRSALQAAVDVCGPGVSFRAIGDAVSSVADAAGFYVVKDFVGHGIGRQFHAAPAVLHHRNLRPGRMQPWQTFTIEPILALGSWKQRCWPLDTTGWTAVTADGSLSAQFEHTLMITDNAVEVLTLHE